MLATPKIPIESNRPKFFLTKLLKEKEKYPRYVTGTRIMPIYLTPYALNATPQITVFFYKRKTMGMKYELLLSAYPSA